MLWMSYTGFKLEIETNTIRPIKTLSSKVALDSPAKFTAIGDVGILTAFDGLIFYLTYVEREPEMTQST